MKLTVAETMLRVNLQPGDMRSHVGTHGERVCDYVMINQDMLEGVVSDQDVLDCKVLSFKWRESDTRRLPCNTRLPVVVKSIDQIEMFKGYAGDFNWSKYTILYWKPNLEAMECEKAEALSCPDVHKVTYSEEEYLKISELAEKYHLELQSLKSNTNFNNGDKLHMGSSDVIFSKYECLAVVSFISSDAPPTPPMRVDVTELQTTSQRKHSELIEELCEELFGEPASCCREDVVSTVAAMVHAGYGKK